MNDTRFVFVTGGVCSSLGKGIVTSALGELHLALLRDERFKNSDITLSILIPYRETCEDGSEWLSWIDCNGNLYIEIDDMLPRKWILLDSVDKEVLKLLQLVVPTKKQWSEIMV